MLRPRVALVSSVTRDAGTTVAELRTANTDLCSTATTTAARNYPIFVSRGGSERLAGSLAESPSQARASRPATSPPPPSPAASDCCNILSRVVIDPRKDRGLSSTLP